MAAAACLPQTRGSHGVGRPPASAVAEWGLESSGNDVTAADHELPEVPTRLANPERAPSAGIQRERPRKV